MTTNEQVQRFNAVKGTDVPLFGRVVGPDGNWSTRSSVTGVSVTVKPTGGAATYTATPAVNTVLYDTLQTSNPSWTDDVNDARTARGYNFLLKLPASAFPSHGWYVVQVTLTHGANGVTKLLYEGAVRGSLS